MTTGWTGRKVRLRAIEPEDWDVFRRFDEHAADQRSVDMLSPPRSKEGYQRWAAERSATQPPDDVFELAIESLADQCMVGGISTPLADRRTGRFRYGIGILREHQRRGYATDAIRVLLAYMFGERRYHRCEVTVYGFNTASLALHEQLGFQVEGRLREHEYFAGRHHDVVVLGMLFDEFDRRYGFSAL